MINKWHHTMKRSFSYHSRQVSHRYLSFVKVHIVPAYSTAIKNQKKIKNRIVKLLHMKKLYTSKRTLKNTSCSWIKQ